MKLEKSIGESNMLKDLYAMALLRQPDNPFGAAVKLVGTDTSRALEISHYWPNDQYVLARQAELLAEFGEEAFLPSKTDLARKVYGMADTLPEGKEKIAALRLYADIRGFIEKTTAIANVTNNTVVQNRVMVMKDHGTDGEWEEKASRQQALLIEHART
jgi:hypothetical protein